MTTIEKQLGASPRNHRYILTVTIIVLILFIWSLDTVSFEDVNQKGISIALNILTGIVTPDLELLFSLTEQGVLYLLLQTTAIAILGTLVGAVLSVPLSFLAASNIVPKPIAWLTRLLLIMIRTIPALVYGLMFIGVTGPGPFAGVLTIGLTSIGMLSKLYVDSIEELDKQVLESMTSLGCNTFEKIRYGIIPQLFSLFMSVTIYRFDMNMREASILGLVGAGGIGAPLIFAMNSYRWNQVGSILIGLVIFILLIEWMSNRLRSKLVNG
ncbi:phosphonate ABC transporter, permease protein PhnE [Paenibacillus urinalis]|uniref:Phosphonate ABC transporter, permease protein PhnE n=1 Tax=Paenibacillus urinalis TaxID=521520 RepID=A0AAX3MU04_9BACL|nr:MULTISPECIES: phosphonate ABC transporter, permease protein PhnE [Paenibacillus]WDH81050.1 phosphonate ABC transporter, permease protein PhnE [Paenibacillus urinalis]WDH97102.1 phosphonate ABC transporter, permease protein PhnE [Paenibacillus urinalis]WDI00765.1 phosphonate ABC transporter, permease protein PhnE [Paenibacillus urinalis]GAK39444.1 phosphonate ABC transporter permease protein [Paenibacillus sp. TCA20]